MRLDPISANLLYTPSVQACGHFPQMSTPAACSQVRSPLLWAKFCGACGGLWIFLDVLLKKPPKSPKNRARPREGGSFLSLN
jgi:hypothetical protein